MGVLLSSPDILIDLAERELAMRRGRITSRERCPACGVAGRYEPAEIRPGVRMLRCVCGGSWATAPIVEMKWKGKKLRIAHGQGGERFPAILDQAEAALSRIREDIQHQRFQPKYWTAPAANKFIWQNYLQAYLDHCEQAQSRATWLKKRSYARHLAWFNGRNVREIRTADVEDFASLPCLELCLAPSSRRELLGILSNLFRWAERREDIAKVPAIPSVEVPEREIPWLMPDEQEAVLSQIPPEHQPIFRFLTIYGCRPSEACALMWDAVDRKRGVISFRRTISACRIEDVTKTRRERLAPIYDEAAALLDSIATGIGPTPVFQNPFSRKKGGAYSNNALNRLWRKAVKAAGLDPIPLKNGTRHSLGMRLRNLDGWQDDEVSLTLGHKSTATTRRFYARPELALLKAKRDRGPRLAPVFDKLSD